MRLGGSPRRRFRDQARMSSDSGADVLRFWCGCLPILVRMSSDSGAAGPPVPVRMSSDSGAAGPPVLVRLVFRFRRGRSSDSDGSGSPTRTQGSLSDCPVSWTERSGSSSDCSGFRAELRFPPRALQRGFAKPCSGAETALATGRVSPEALQGAWREPGRVLREPSKRCVA